MKRTEQRSVRGGAAGGVLRSGSGSGTEERWAVGRCGAPLVPGAALPGCVGSASGGASGVAGRDHYRHIRDYF